MALATLPAGLQDSNLLIPDNPEATAHLMHRTTRLKTYLSRMVTLLRRPAFSRQYMARDNLFPEFCETETVMGFEPTSLAWMITLYLRPVIGQELESERLAPPELYH